jgi:hypothetical protein
MISIIICARKNDISDTLKENIRQSIGVHYEIIVIDNSQNEHTIFSAYNKGVALSHYPILLFMHDDIHYHTGSWGLKVLKHFEDPKIGAIGVAGTPYMPHTPGGWWSTGAGYLYLLQSASADASPKLENYFPENEITRNVVALDGVWFCIRKEIFNQIRFDESTFKGFHLYDIDISLQVYEAGYQLLCVKDILIHHFSTGALNEQWVQTMLLFNKKWKSKLPVSCSHFTRAQKCLMEYRVVNTFISDQLRLAGKLNTSPSRIYWSAIKKMMGFRPGYLYSKTPYWLIKLFIKYLLNINHS